MSHIKESPPTAKMGLEDILVCFGLEKFSQIKAFMDF
jgi:hypothetical protein